jgi:hypothetical protein
MKKIKIFWYFNFIKENEKKIMIAFKWQVILRSRDFFLGTPFFYNIFYVKK